MICLVSPNGHGDCIFEFATNSSKNVLETYESKPSTEIRVEKNNSVIDLTFYEDGEKIDKWPVADLFFKDINACMLRFPEFRAYLEGM